MGLRKCPRCELNYIRDDEKYCEVCRRDMKGDYDADEGEVMCAECGEHPAVKGSDLCHFCLREARRQAKLSSIKEEAIAADKLSLDNVELDGIEVPITPDDDIPESELDEIDKELGEDDGEGEDIEDIDDGDIGPEADE